jgi:hypothetical protein
MPTHADIRQATWSIQYYTQFRSRASASDSVLPAAKRQDLLPIDLLEAIDILIKNSDEHDRARRRNAFVKLGTAGLFDRNRLKRFFGHDDAVAQKAFDLIVGLGRKLGLKNVADAMSQNRLSLPKYVDKELSLILANTTECLPMETTCVACLDGKTWETTVTARARVPRPLQELAAVLDPRSWPQCSTVFQDIEVVELDPITSIWKVLKNPSLPNLGEPWSTAKTSPGDPERGLRERVTIGATAAGGFVAEFVNVLNVELTVETNNYDPLTDEIRIRYSLNESLSSLLFGQVLDGGLVNDEGYGLAVRDKLSPSDWTRVEMKKTIQFRDLTDAGGAFDYGELLNYTAPGISCLWLEDTTELSPCCHPA